MPREMRLKPWWWVCVFLVLIALVIRACGGSVLAAPLAAPAVSVPTGDAGVIGEGEDYATLVMADPWDMNESSDAYFGNTNPPDGGITGLNFSNGVMSFQTTGSDPWFWLVHKGWTGAERVGKDGYNYPIETSKYRILSFRARSNIPAQAQVRWFYDDSYTKHAYSYFLDISGDDQYHTYTVDLQNYYWGGVGGATGWEDTVRGLRFDPANDLSIGAIMHFDWMRLSSDTPGPMLPISYSGVDRNDTLEFYIDDDNSGFNGTKIGQIQANSRSGTFNWGESLQPAGSGKPYPMPAAIQPGQYYVYIRVNFRDDSRYYSANPFTIRPTPIVWVTKPSPTTGADYAATVVGDPWDMSNSEDLSHKANISDEYFSDGIWNATTVGYDPYVHFKTTSPIDSNTYKYATWRLYVEGVQYNGGSDMWGGRIFWYETFSEPDPYCTSDVVLGEGWNTYTLDLTNLRTPGICSKNTWTDNNWSVFRLDPVENPSMKVHLDYMLLTAEDRDEADSTFQIKWEISDCTVPVTTILYYDRDQNWGGGTEIAVIPAISSCPDCTNFVYLPLILKGPGGNPAPPDCQKTYTWDTTGLSGTYYIWVKIEDGHNTTYWCSKTPVIIS